MAGPITQAGEEVVSALGRFDPSNLDELEGVFPDLKELFEGLAAGIKGLSAKFGDDLPVKPHVAEAIGELGAALAGLGDAAEEAHSLFLTAHEDEINRIRNPRPNERIWDTTANQ